jgi:hypothetical protein
MNETSVCWCIACNEDKTDPTTGLSVLMFRMVLCPTCGNKRCPHATNHTFACTQSNEPGQQGSVYGGPPTSLAGTAPLLAGVLASPWVELKTELPHFSKEGGDPGVLLYSSALAGDREFPGHPYLVSNPEFVANGNALKNFGVTHWMALFPPDAKPPALDVNFKHSRAARAEAVLRALEEWIAKHQPSSADALYQVDSINLAAPELANDLCDIAGYYQDPSEEA